MYLAVLHIYTHTSIYARSAVIYATRIIVKGAYMHKTENIYVDAYMLQIGAYMLHTVFIYASIGNIYVSSCTPCIHSY